MECVAASGAPDSSPGHPEATHEVFSWTRKYATVFLFDVFVPGAIAGVHLAYFVLVMIYK